MPVRVYENDASIGDAERLFRRLPPTWVLWDEDGSPRISSAAFKDEELSINLESVMASAGRSPSDAVRDYAGYGLAAFTAGEARALNQKVARDPNTEEPAHGVVFGPKKRGGVAQRLRDASYLVVVPSRTEIGSAART